MCAIDEYIDGGDLVIFGLIANCVACFRVGVFSTLTNSYALVAVGASENFYRYDITEWIE